MAKPYQVEQWVQDITRCTNSQERDQLVGVSFTLAAELLRVTRSRIHQLAKENKLTVIDVYARKTRIGHLVTLASIDRRRKTVKPRRTQWRSNRQRYG